MMQKNLQVRLQEIFSGPVRIERTFPVSGGCINQSQILLLDNGERVFMKSNDHAPENFFLTEAKGLLLLSTASGGPKIPRPLETPSAQASDLLIECMEESPAPPDYPVIFAQALANLHRVTQDVFGLDHDNFIGKTRQINDLTVEGLTFFRDQRIGFQQELARKQGLLPPTTDRELDRLKGKLPELLNLDGERPALLHGDLWSGNHFPVGGRPCLFDPAVYFGFREADLAMTRLFGSLPERFYSAYREIFPLLSGWQEREDIFNLYHLLNHLNLFGTSYLGSVQQITKRYAGNICTK